MYTFKNKIDKAIDVLLKTFEMEYDSILGIEILITEIDGAMPFLLEYLKANKNILTSNHLFSIQKSTLIFNHIARIYEYLGEKCCFDVRPPIIDNEIVPPFPEKE